MSWEIGRVFCQQVLGQELAPIPSIPSLDHLRSVSLPARDTVVIHPGASAACKRWPAENFCDLANLLSAQHPVAWIESPEVSATGLNKEIRRIRTKTLRELTGWLDRALLFIGNNSGPMNIASILDTPSLILNGPPGVDPPANAGSIARWPASIASGTAGLKRSVVSTIFRRSRSPRN